MRNIFDLYGFYSEDIELAQKILEEVLNKKMIEHESGYRGEYLRLDIGHENFILQRNIDYFDNECLETEFPDYPIILYISYTNRSGKLMESLEGTGKYTLLKHNEYD